MIPVNVDWLIGIVSTWMLLSMRLVGCFLVMPLLSFRALPLRSRLLMALVLAYAVLPSIQGRYVVSTDLASASYGVAVIELAIGMAAGWVVRVGLMAFDLLAEVISVETGLSFASTYFRDPSLASGLAGEFIGLLALAIAFTLNIHLVFLDVIFSSYQTLPPGTWPASWNWPSVLTLVAKSFSFGVVLSLPVIVLYLMLNMTQAVLARVSPQLNLFSIGFAIFVPVAFLVLAIVIPSFAETVQRALEPAFEWIRAGVARPSR